MAEASKKILVVEDDQLTRDLLRELLRAAGYSVVIAGDGVTALRKVKQGTFGLVVLDIWMPRMNGLEFLSKLRELRNPPKVLVITGDDTPDTLLEAVREQAYRYVTKPVEPRVLLELVRDAIATEAPTIPIEVVSARPNWVELLVPCQVEVVDRIQSFLTGLKADLPQEVRESVGHAFRELLLNAMEWGGQFDPRRKVRIAYLRTNRLLLYRIADPGLGFRFQELTHAALSNPADDPLQHRRERQARGLRPGGFGILLARALVDEVLYNEAQNEVVLIKYLEKGSSPSS